MKQKAHSIKICAGASSGGHMNQLLALLNYTDSWPKEPDFYVTTLSVLASKLAEKSRAYTIGEANRYHPILATGAMIRALRIVLNERPDVVITTGSMPLAFFCLFAKIFSAKIVWVDSVANIKQFSMSGRLVKRFADLFLTQWPDLAEKDQKAEYVGAIL